MKVREKLIAATVLLASVGWVPAIGGQAQGEGAATLQFPAMRGGLYEVQTTDFQVTGDVSEDMKGMPSSFTEKQCLENKGGQTATPFELLFPAACKPTFAKVEGNRFSVRMDCADPTAVGTMEMEGTYTENSADFKTTATVRTPGKQGVMNFTGNMRMVRLDQSCPLPED